MLTPDYFYGKSDRLVEMYQELEDWILKDIAMRLMKSGEMSGTADRELWKLQQMGLHNTEIVKRISQLTGKSRDEVRRLLRDSVMTSFSDDMEVLQKLGNFVPPMYNDSVIKVMDAELKKTFGELDNLTQSTMMQTQKDLLNMLNEVEFRVSSGMQSYSSAVCEVLDRYAKGGVVIDYPTGARRTLEAAVRCCIVTSMNQTAAQVTNQYIVEGGIEYVLVSAHMGARHDDKHPDGVPSHDHWQGKVYKIQGADDDTPNLLEATGYTITSSGTGKVVNPLGLHGYNCRHSHKPWDKSLRNPYVDENGNPKIDIHESQELYEKQSAQRRMERAIRQTKRQLLAKQEELNGIAETDVRDMLQPEYDRLAYRLRMQNQKYKQFCANNGLQTQYDRVKVAGFKRAQAAKANGRATSYQNKEKLYAGVPKEWDNSGHPLVSLKAINPTGNMENCANCITAYEMRQRGFKVIANEIPNKTLMREPWKAWKNTEVIEEYSKDDIISLAKVTHGNCRYGLAFAYDEQRGHCVVLEKYQDMLSIVDAQSGERYNVEEYSMPEYNIKAWKTMENGELAELSEIGGKACKKIE